MGDNTQYNINTPYSGPDRRNNTSMELQQSILKVLAKVETMEANIETKLDAHTKITSSEIKLVVGRLENLEDKLTNNIESKERRIIEVEKKLDIHTSEDEQVNKILDKHDRDLEKASAYVDRIHMLENNYIKLNKRVDKLEQTPAQEALEDRIDTKKQIKTQIITFLLGGSLVGLIVTIILALK